MHRVCQALCQLLLRIKDVTDEVLVALWISGVSLLVAGASLSWQIYNALRVDRARLEVTVESRVMAWGPGVPPQDVVFVQAINTGKRATFLTGLWLGLGQSKWPPWKRVLPERWRGEFHSGVLVPGTLNVQHGTSIPSRLEPGDLAIALYERDLVMRRLEEQSLRTVWGFALASTSTVRGRARPLDDSQLEKASHQVGSMINVDDN